MAKRPSKPEGQRAQPRFRSNNSKSLPSVVEAARRLTDLVVSDSDMHTGKYFETDDRSFAILRGANVENALEIALSKVIIIHEGEKRALFRSDGPLGSFSNKITMAYALSAIGPVTKNNLDITRHVRNVFAHAKKNVDFETKEIIALCSFYQLPSKLESSDAVFKDDETYPVEKMTKSPSRNGFFVSTCILELSLLRFVNRAIYKETGIVDNVKHRIVFDDTLP